MAMLALASPVQALDYVWNGSDGSWDDAGRWSLLGVPGAGDRAFIGSGLVTLPGDRTVGQLHFGGGRLDGAGLDVLGASSWSSGFMSGSGTRRFQSDLLLAGDGTRSLLDTSLLLITQGTTRWEGNTRAAGNAISFGQRSAVIRNTGGWIDSNAFDTQFTGQVIGHGTFDNQGSYIKTGRSTTTIFSRLENSGTVTVDAGRLYHRGGGQHTGSFHVAEGARLEFGTGSGTPNVFTATSRLTGTGTLTFSGGTPTGDVIEGAWSHAGLTEIRGNDLRVQGSFSASTFMMDGGRVSGSGVLSVSGPASFLGGLHDGSGTTRFESDLLLGGNGNRQVGSTRLVLTAGTTLWQGNTGLQGNEIRNDGVIRNTGSWTDGNTFDTRIRPLNGTIGTGTFDNQGSFRKLGASTTEVSNRLLNSGSVDVQAGTLRLRTAFENRGSLQVRAGATLETADPSFINFGTLSGNGTVRTAPNQGLLNNGLIAPGLSTGLLTVDGDLILAATSTLQIELASLSQFDALTILGDANLTGGIQVVNLGYTPTVGDRFVIIRFNQRLSQGQFVGLDSFGWGPEVDFSLTYNLTDVTLTVTAVPEPETWALWLLGLTCMAARLGRRRRSGAH